MSKIYASQATQGFYHEQIHGSRIPADAIELTEDQYQAALTIRSTGREFSIANDGSVLAVDPPPPPPPTVLEQIRTLESKVTQRRLREALLGTDGGWLAGIDAQIADLRAQI